MLAYYLLTGSHPFAATDAVSLLCAQVTTPVDAPSLRRGAALPADLERLVLRCLDRAPAERPPSATALAAMLGACADAGAWSADVARAWWAAAS